MSSGVPLRVAMLWHFHQPDYRTGRKAMLPWVRLHAIKDYGWLPALQQEFPSLRVTYSISPILLEQLEQYAAGTLDDEHQVFSRLDARSLTPQQREQYAQWLFVGNYERMIHPVQRYDELYRQYHSGQWEQWTSQEWQDLQVWMCLSWFGPHLRHRKAVDRLLSKGRNFTPDELAVVISIEQEELSAVVKRLAAMSSVQHAEIAVCPYYHPILPLLCDSGEAKNLPLAKLDPGFCFPDDAHEHVQRAHSAAQHTFGTIPQGIWLSEGAISDDALGVLVSHNVRWTATDEVILRKTLNSDDVHAHFQPYIWRSAEGRKIVLFFRDHALSDAIGFVYSQLDAVEAAKDFISRLEILRSQLYERFGEEFVARAIVPVILDGENCWGFYEKNGEPFLRALYTMLDEHSELKTVTFADAAAEALQNELTPRIDRIAAGSWIDGTFRIWAGTDVHQTAWSLLRDTRSLLEKYRIHLPDPIYQRAYEHILIAEGSDWFWWYSPEHHSQYQIIFDELFRYHLMQVYNILEVPTPSALHQPLQRYSHFASSRYGAMHPATATNEFQHDD